jgi:uncharacterized membrane protein
MKKLLVTFLLLALAAIAAAAGSIELVRRASVGRYSALKLLTILVPYGLR